MKSYVKYYHWYLLNMNKEEAEEQFKKEYGISQFDMIPIWTLMFMILDVLQVFIPKLRLK